MKLCARWAFGRRTLLALSLGTVLVPLAVGAIAPRGPAQGGAPTPPQPWCVRGAWSTPHDWEIFTCSGKLGGYGGQDPCYGGPDCDGSPWGEIPHAILVLSDPDAETPKEWRVLLVNTGHFESQVQPWWIWDPATPDIVDPGDGGPDVLFCSGHTVGRDGAVHFVGGQKWPAYPGGACTPLAPNWAWRYDPALGTAAAAWTQLPDMEKGRYYPGASVTSDGRVLALSGDQVVQMTFEAYDPSTNTWSGPLAYSTVPQCAMAYPQAFVLPAITGALSALFVSSPYGYEPYQPYHTCIVDSSPADQPTELLDLLPGGGFGAWRAGPQPVTAPNNDRADGGAVLVVDARGAEPLSRVVLTGGKPHPFVNGPAYDAVEEVHDPHLASSTWQPLPSLNYPRFFHASVLLPGQRLLVLGGSNPALPDPFVRTPEVLELDPLAQTWEELEEHEGRRGYHCAALLLPDGRILLLGGRRPDDALPYPHAEIFSPPFLCGARPALGDVAKLATYGSMHDVPMRSVPASGISSFELIRPGSMTHATDFDQRLVVLDWVQVGLEDFQVALPSGGDVAPPGWYMLFAVSGEGVPSVARFVHLDAP